MKQIHIIRKKEVKSPGCQKKARCFDYEFKLLMLDYLQTEFTTIKYIPTNKPNTPRKQFCRRVNFQHTWKLILVLDAHDADRCLCCRPCFKVC